MEKFELHKLVKEYGHDFYIKEFFKETVEAFRKINVYKYEFKATTNCDFSYFFYISENKEFSFNEEATYHSHLFFENITMPNANVIKNILSSVYESGLEHGVYKEKTDGEVTSQDKINNIMRSVINLRSKALSINPNEIKERKNNYNLKIVHSLRATEENSFIHTSFFVPTKYKHFKFETWQVNNIIYLTSAYHPEELDVTTLYTFDINDPDYLIEMKKVLAIRLKNLYYYYHFANTFKKFYKKRFATAKIQELDLKSMQTMIQLYDY